VASYPSQMNRTDHRRKVPNLAEDQLMGWWQDKEGDTYSPCHQPQDYQSRRSHDPQRAVIRSASSARLPPRVCRRIRVA
jgi:hypothetical protein